MKASNTSSSMAADRAVAQRHSHFIDIEERGNVSYSIVFTLRSGKETQFLELLRPVLDAMRHEPMFCNAILHRDPSASNRFMLYESWLDADDVMNVQVHRAYRQAFWAGLPALLEVARDVQTWLPLRGDFVFDAPCVRGAIG